MKLAGYQIFLQSILFVVEKMAGKETQRLPFYACSAHTSVCINEVLSIIGLKATYSKFHSHGRIRLQRSRGVLIGRGGQRECSVVTRAVGNDQAGSLVTECPV